MPKKIVSIVLSASFVIMAASVSFSAQSDGTRLFKHRTISGSGEARGFGKGISFNREKFRKTIEDMKLRSRSFKLKRNAGTEK